MIQEPCAICGKLNEYERSIFEQNGYVLCRGHHELFNDEELEERINDKHVKTNRNV